MSKSEDPAAFVEWLRDQTELALQKMNYEQQLDPNCVWAEFESLILGLDDFFKQVREKKIVISFVDHHSDGSSLEDWFSLNQPS